MGFHLIQKGLTFFRQRRMTFSEKSFRPKLWQDECGV
jgi:hypothetical protein